MPEEKIPNLPPGIPHFPIRQRKILQNYLMIKRLHHTHHFVNAERLLNDWDAIFSGNDTKTQDFAWRYMNYLMWKEIFGK